MIRSGDILLAADGAFYGVITRVNHDREIVELERMQYGEVRRTEWNIIKLMGYLSEGELFKASNIKEGDYLEHQEEDVEGILIKQYESRYNVHILDGNIAYYTHPVHLYTIIQDFIITGKNWNILIMEGGM